MATEPARGCGRVAVAERLRRARPAPTRPPREVPSAAAATKPRGTGWAHRVPPRPPPRRSPGTRGGRAAPRRRGGGAGRCDTGGAGRCGTGAARRCGTGAARRCGTGGAGGCDTGGAAGWISPAVRRDGYHLRCGGMWHRRDGGRSTSLSVMRGAVTETARRVNPDLDSQ
ncbi:translation initiation factor IF-2-like isoform X2 [Corvus cornix cornix]|uniref:translation initiation factor IF-2-like isoform X2 n=1 Tax=Corvus cornix cornix TaxID=932674 RepID=UPI00195010C9|nr:translation initiation factor IF-2-like isoform X2 [Corvus cornix cornix]